LQEAAADRPTVSQTWKASGSTWRRSFSTTPASIGLVALYVGLQREVRWLRLAGLGLFGLALAKLFLYSPSCSSTTSRS
jgi:uncharacterized membrane protein